MPVRIFLTTYILGITGHDDRVKSIIDDHANMFAQMFPGSRAAEVGAYLKAQYPYASLRVEYWVKLLDRVRGRIKDIVERGESY